MRPAEPDGPPAGFLAAEAGGPTALLSSRATYQVADSRPLKNLASQGDERPDASPGPASGNVRS